MLTIVPEILEMLHDWVLIDSDGAGQSARQAVTGGGRSERRPRGEPTFAKAPARLSEKAPPSNIFLPQHLVAGTWQKFG